MHQLDPKVKRCHAQTEENLASTDAIPKRLAAANQATDDELVELRSWNAHLRSEHQ